MSLISSIGSGIADSVATGLVKGGASGNTDLDAFNVEIDLDFRDGKSYPGMGTAISSMQANPNSGASQSDYEFTLPAGWSFTDGYVTADGLSLIDKTTPNTSFLNGLNRSDDPANWGLAVVVYLVSGSPNSRMLLDTRGNSNLNPGLFLYFASTDNRIPVAFQRGDTGFSDAVVGTTQVAALTPSLVVWTWDKGNTDARIWVNGVETEDTTSTYNTCTTNGQKLAIGGSPFSANNYLANGERVYQWILFRQALTTSDEATIRSTLETRTGLSF